MSKQVERLYEFGPYRLNPAQQILLHGIEKIPLTPKAFQTLLVLVEANGQIVPKDELLQRVWPETFVEEATLAQNVFTIRKLLQVEPGAASYIETVPKRGYRFVAPVQVREISPAAHQNAPGVQPTQNPESRSRTRVLVLAGTTAALLIALTVVWYLKHRPATLPTAPASGRIVLAVLPVTNLTGDPAEEYLADGLTEEVIADLGAANPQHLGVIARTSAMAYKPAQKTIQQIAKELGADYVLESSLRESSGHVRFTAQLIRTQDQTHLWAQNFDRSKTDVLTLQGELARTVAEQIRIELPAEAAARLSTTRTVSPQAYDAYLKGRFFWNQRNAASMTAAEKYFQQAIRLDPGFAPAYAGLADCYQVMVNLGQIKPAEGYAQARATALKALEIDDTLAEAHTSLASIKGDFDWDWPGAEAEYKRALELNQNYATAHHWYAEYLAGIGRIDEATSEIKKAMALDPLSPVIAVSLGQMYCRAGLCQEGIEQLKRSLAMYPDFEEAHEALAEIYAHFGMYEPADAELKTIVHSPAGHIDLILGEAAAHAGHQREAIDILHKFETDTNMQHRDLYLAVLYASLSDKDGAFSHLESARKQHDPFMAYFRGDLALQSLRSDPRYNELTARMNMPR